MPNSTKTIHKLKLNRLDANYVSVLAKGRAPLPLLGLDGLKCTPDGSAAKAVGIECDVNFG